MGIFRAVECRRPLIRSANTGISGFIRSSGHIVERLDPFQEGGVVHRPEVSGVTSFYLKYGDAFAWACFLGLLLVFFPDLKVFKPH